jgi:hypothetical protein
MTSKAPPTMSGLDVGGLVEGGRPRWTRIPSSVVRTASTVAVGMVLTSTGGHMSEWSHRLTANGRLVSVRT